jgi:hypothetical protein
MALFGLQSLSKIDPNLEEGCRDSSQNTSPALAPIKLEKYENSFSQGIRDLAEIRNGTYPIQTPGVITELPRSVNPVHSRFILIISLNQCIGVARSRFDFFPHACFMPSPSYPP